MRRRVSLLLVATSLAVVSASGDARADGDAEGAKKHFEAGRKLRDEGDCSKAVSEFQQSVAADKSIGAYYNLGFCEEQLGRRQEAYDAYRRAKELASAKKDERLKEISGALAALLETPNVRLVLPQPPPPGLQIFVDGTLVPPASYLNETVVFTKPMPVHDVRATAPGFDDFVAKAETRELKAIDLKPAGTSLGPKVAAPPPPPAPTHWSTQHWAGLGVIVGGAIAFTIGGVMFLSYRVDEGQLGELARNAEKACIEPRPSGSCDARVPNLATPDLNDRIDNPNLNRDRAATRKSAVDAYNAREKLAGEQTPLMASLMIGGFLAIGGGIALMLTARSVPDAAPKTAAAALKPSAAVTPVFSPTFQGLALRGRF